MQNDIKQYIAKCDSCQHLKKQKKHYGHLPMKEAEYKPWDKLCVDLIGEHIIKWNGKNKNLKMKPITMIDPAIGWFEIKQFKDKQSNI